MVLEASQCFCYQVLTTGKSHINLNPTGLKGTVILEIKKWDGMTYPLPESIYVSVDFGEITYIY